MTVNFPFFESYILVDAVCIVLTVIAAAQMSRNSGSETQVRMFFLFLTSYIVFLITDAIWAFFVFSGLIVPSYFVLGVVNLVNRVAIAATGYYWFCYSLVRFESKTFFRKSFRLITALPILLVFGTYAIGLSMGWKFIAAGAGDQQGALDYLVVSFVSLFYLVTATIAAIRGYRRATTAAQRNICTIFTAFMIAPAIAAIINLIDPDLPVIALGILVSILLVVLSLQEARIFSDELTGLNNRRRANAYLEESIGHASTEHPVYLFIVDMNRFKSINDTYGHLEGDHALQIVAQALLDSCKPLDAFAARWGGDEFMIICAHGTCSDPTLVVNTIDQNLNDAAKKTGVRYELSCSVGFAECHSPDTVTNDLISKADAMLYSKKSSSFSQRS